MEAKSTLNCLASCFAYGVATTLLPPYDAGWIDKAKGDVAEAGFDGKTTSEEGDEDCAAKVVGDGEGSIEGGAH